MKVTLVVSYPRSGINWLRCCTELLTGIPTRGKFVQLLPNRGVPVAFLRAHQAHQCTAHYDQMILLLRDYHESHARCTSQEVGAPFSAYSENILAFEAFEGPKLKLHYEDHVTSMEQSQYAVTFMGHPIIASSDEILNFEGARQASLERYINARGSVRATTSPHKIAKRAVMRALGATLYNKYLRRYDEKGR